MNFPMAHTTLSLADKALLLWQALGVSNGEVELLLQLCPKGGPPGERGGERVVAEATVGLIHVRRMGQPGPLRSGRLSMVVARLILLLRARDALLCLAQERVGSGDDRRGTARGAQPPFHEANRPRDEAQDETNDQR